MLEAYSPFIDYVGQDRMAEIILGEEEGFIWVVENVISILLEGLCLFRCDIGCF